MTTATVDDPPCCPEQLQIASDVMAVLRGSGNTSARRLVEAADVYAILLRSHQRKAHPGGRPMRAIVTGSREYRDRELVRRVLDELYAEHGKLDLVHGGCPYGADWHAQEWAVDRQRGPDEYAKVRTFVFRANWRVGKSAGPARNRQMIASGGDLVVAFFAPPPAGNKGTAGCVELARRAGIPVREYGRETPATSDPDQGTLPI